MREATVGCESGGFLLLSATKHVGFLLPHFFSKRVKNGGILVEVEKNLYLCIVILKRVARKGALSCA